MILFVEDDAALAETCSMYLEAHGFEVIMAESCAKALHQISLVTPELVIADCAMPSMTGLELSKTLKGDPVTAAVPVLLISASLRRDVAPGTSYDGFLRKPFLAEKLMVEVQRLLAKPSNADNTQ